MITLNERSSSSLKILFPFIAGVGLGVLLHAPYQVFTRALQSKDTAIGTSAFFLLRFTGATIGLVRTFLEIRDALFSQFNTQSLAGTVFNIRLSNTLPSGYPGNPSTIDLTTVQSITPPELRDQVLHAIARSIQVCLLVVNSTVTTFLLQGRLDDLDVVLSVPRSGSSRESLASLIDDAPGLSSTCFAAHDADENQFCERL